MVTKNTFANFATELSSFRERIDRELISLMTNSEVLNIEIDSFESPRNKKIEFKY